MMPKFYILDQIFLSQHAAKNDTNLKKKIVFFKSVVGRLCATCTETGYPCFICVFFNQKNSRLFDKQGFCEQRSMCFEPCFRTLIAPKSDIIQDSFRSKVSKIDVKTRLGFLFNFYKKKREQ